MCQKRALYIRISNTINVRFMAVYLHGKIP
jgi:hypothetical protein